MSGVEDDHRLGFAPGLLLRIGLRYGRAQDWSGFRSRRAGAIHSSQLNRQNGCTAVDFRCVRLNDPDWAMRVDHEPRLAWAEQAIAERLDQTLRLLPVGSIDAELNLRKIDNDAIRIGQDGRLDRHLPRQIKHKAGRIALSCNLNAMSHGFAARGFLRRLYCGGNDRRPVCRRVSLLRPCILRRRQGQHSQAKRYRYATNRSPQPLPNDARLKRQRPS